MNKRSRGYQNEFGPLCPIRPWYTIYLLVGIRFWKFGPSLSFLFFSPSFLQKSQDTVDCSIINKEITEEIAWIVPYRIMACIALHNSNCIVYARSFFVWTIQLHFDFFIEV